MKTDNSGSGGGTTFLRTLGICTVLSSSVSVSKMLIAITVLGGGGGAGTRFFLIRLSAKAAKSSSKIFPDACYPGWDGPGGNAGSGTGYNRCFAGMNGQSVSDNGDNCT